MIARLCVPAALALLLAGCPSSKTSTATNTVGPTPPTEGKPPVASAIEAPPAAKAAVGQKAPDFSLADLDGKKVELAAFAGKTIVLEWFNPQCPFIKEAHTHTLRDYGNELVKKGVVVLAINSAAPGKQGNDPKENVAARERFGIQYPILLDPTGVVGKSYGATNTPHMFVIDDKGVLVYEGAIDDTQGGDPDPGETVTNYVEQALQSIAKGTPPKAAHTKAWGCGVKYGS